MCPDTGKKCRLTLVRADALKRAAQHNVMRHQTLGPFVAQWPLSATAVVGNLPLSPNLA